MARRRLPSHTNVATVDLDTKGFATGEALARPITVKGALAGEEIEARIVGRRKGRIVAVAETIRRSSSERTQAACRYFPRCGGCALQHWDYEAQIAFKRAGLLRELASVGVEPQRVLATVTSSRFYYRRKARIGVRWLDSTNEPLVGFRESFSNRVVRMDACMTLDARCSNLMDALKTLMIGLSVKREIPQIEIAIGDEGVGIVVRHLTPFSSGDLDLLRAFSTDHDVRVFGQSGGYESIRVIAPADAGMTFTYRLDAFGLCLEFSPVDFIQVNQGVNNMLILCALSDLQLSSADHLLDLFSGIGNFSLAARRLGAEVTGIEMSMTAVRRARTNACRNGLRRRIAFDAADIYSRNVHLETQRFTKVLLDPPRSGVGGAIASWIGPNVQRIVYVSCNPQTFALDARLLGTLGFTLKTLRIFDMFPHTSHVESLGVFEKQ